jgi:hypothetical protein
MGKERYTNSISTPWVKVRPLRLHTDSGHIGATGFAAAREYWLSRPQHNDHSGRYRGRSSLRIIPFSSNHFTDKR